MTYYVQPQDSTWTGTSYGLSDTSGAGYAAALNAMGPAPAQNIVSSGGPQLDFSSPDDMMYYGGWDMSGGQQNQNQVDPWGGQNTIDWTGSDIYNSGSDIAYGDWGASQQPQYNANYGYEYNTPDYSDYADWGTYGGTVEQNPNVGYEYGSSSDYTPSGGGVSPGTNWTASNYGQYTPTAYGWDYSNRYGGGVPSAGGGGGGGGQQYSTNRSSRQTGGQKPPAPPPARYQPMPTLVSGHNAVPLPTVTPPPTTPTYSLLPQTHEAWDRLQNFIKNPSETLQSDPMYNAILTAGNRNIAGQNRAGRQRFSGAGNAKYEQYGAEIAAQNLDRIANMYGASAGQELARWQPEAAMGMQAQQQQYADQLNAWRANMSAELSRYGYSQKDIDNLIRATAVNNQSNAGYYSDLGAQDMLNYQYQLQNFYGM